MHMVQANLHTRLRSIDTVKTIALNLLSKSPPQFMAQRPVGLRMHTQHRPRGKSTWAGSHLFRYTYVPQELKSKATTNPRPDHNEGICRPL